MRHNRSMSWTVSSSPRGPTPLSPVRTVKKTTKQKMAALCLLGFLGACAQNPVESGVFMAETTDQDYVEVLTIGYNSINQKYIHAISVADFASEGLRGLSGIDPMLAVIRSSEKVVITLEGVPVRTFSAPGPDDVEGWVTLSVNLIDEARGLSAQLSHASSEAIFEALFDGALSNLDIFSRYAGREEARDNRARRDGFGGIGIQFRNKKGKIIITDVMPGSPADLAGLSVGDSITHVGEIAIDGMTRRDVSRQLRGPINSAVGISLIRGADATSAHMEMVRSHIIPKTVYTSLDGGILTARVTNYNQNTTRSLHQALSDTVATQGRKLKGVVLDLRGNPGGLLSQSIKMADLFLTDGEIISTRGRHRDAFQHYTAHGKDVINGRPMVVLVDGKSASAAEVTAATLQDRGRAVVLGTTSFGKGSVQTVVRLPNSGEMTLTWSHLIAPSGYAFHGLGLLPSFCTSDIENQLTKNDRKALDSHATRTKALNRIFERMRTRITAQEWRLPGIQDEKRRKDLRKACPPERRKSRPLDGLLARYVITDPSLYAHAAGDSSATALAN